MKHLVLALAFAAPLACASPVTIDWASTIDHAECTGLVPSEYGPFLATVACPAGWIGSEAHGSVTYDLLPGPAAYWDSYLSFPLFDVEDFAHLTIGSDGLSYNPPERFLVGAYLLNDNLYGYSLDFIAGTFRLLGEGQYAPHPESPQLNLSYISGPLTVPEPATPLLIGAGCAWLITLRRYRIRAKGRKE